MSRTNIEVVLRGRTLGEGPHWVEKSQELLFVDMLNQSIHRYVPSTGQEFQIPLGENPSLIVPVDGEPEKYIVSMDTNLTILEWDGSAPQAKKIDKIWPIPQKEVKATLNDGKCDPQGRLWAGTIGMGEKLPASDKGSLYRLGLDGQLKSQVDKIGIANGLAWTTDSSKFFYVDSMTYRVDVFDFDAQNGVPSNRRVLFDYKENGIKGLPDGMAVDSQNNIWLASYMGAQVLHIDSTTGTLIDTINFEGRTSIVSSVAFGGPNLDTLYVTSGNFAVPELVPNHVVTDEVDAGALFKVTNVGAKGVMGGGVSYKGKLPNFPNA